jgi:putative lipoprotein
MPLLRYYLIFISFLGLLLSCSKKNDKQTAEIPTGKTKQEQKEGKVFVFDCDKNYSFVVQVAGQEAILFLPEKTITLPYVFSASGAKYEKDKVVFWIKGEEAMLEINEQIYKNCINNRRQAIWEEAKLRGVDFRAVGNEPGWHLEISKDRIIFVTNYGSEQYEFPAAEPVSDNRAQTIYQTNNEKTTLEIVLSGKPCLDTMSDDSFETTVVIKLNSREYNGCGRALH